MRRARADRDGSAIAAEKPPPPQWLVPCKPKKPDTYWYAPRDAKRPMIPVAEIGYVRRSELPNDGPIQRPRRHVYPINSRRVDGVQTGGRFAMVATIPQKRSQMRDDMLKGLPLVLFALDLNIGFNVPSGQS